MTTPLRPERVLVACAADAASRPDLEQLAVHLARSGFPTTLAIVDLSEPHVSLPFEADRPGLRVVRIGAPPFPLVCGWGRSQSTAALRRSHALAHAIGSERFDLAVCPLADGLAHGLLMDRGTDVRNSVSRIVLWLDVPSRWEALAEDRSFTDIAPLVGDALERTALRLADALIAPDRQASRRLAGLPEPPPLVWTGSPVLLRPPDPATPAPPIREIVFAGRLSRREGAFAFMDAVEDLAHRGRLGDCEVTFLGPVPDSPSSLGASMLGVRAQRWAFPFKVVDTADEGRMLSYLREPGRLAVFAGEDSESGRLFRGALSQGARVVAPAFGAGDGAPVGCDAQSLADGIEAAMRDDGASADIVPDLFAGIETALLAVVPRAPPRPGEPVRGVSVCITHRFRPALLAKAIASVAPSGDVEIETVVIDNGGEPPFVPEAGTARVVRLERPLPPVAAYNRGVAASRGEIVVFLDDDNLLARGGLERFVRALSTGWFDIVVTTLDLFDGEADSGRAAGRMIFLGDAGMAGLFFNGFGDTALAIRRDAFLRIGGFRERGHLVPVWDWELLARARAAGLRIGVLQEPAIRYARSIGGEAQNWLKLDRDGGRRAVLEAYGEAIDGPLVARYAQGLRSRD